VARKTKPCSVCAKVMQVDKRRKTGLCRTCWPLSEQFSLQQSALVKARWAKGDHTAFRRGGPGVWLSDIPPELLEDYRNLTRKKHFSADEARALLGLPPRVKKDA